jgi:hypothetical protein
MWFGFTTIILAVFQVYYVQETVAALIIFSVLVAFVGETALILFVFDRASQRALAWRKRCGPEANVLARLQHAESPPKSGIA